MDQTIVEQKNVSEILHSRIPKFLILEVPSIQQSVIQPWHHQISSTIWHQRGQPSAKAKLLRAIHKLRIFRLFLTPSSIHSYGFIALVDIGKF